MSSVPRSLRYDLLSQAAPCRTWTSQFFAENGQTFREGSSTWITIPSGGQNQFLAPDVRLCFSVTNTSAEIITLDGTICSAISKLEVYCGSNLLVSVQEYGALFSMLYDTQVPSTHRSTAGKLLGVSDTARMGEPIENYLFGENINAGATETFSVPLLCGLFHLSDKEISLGQLQADLRIKIDWEQTANYDCRGAGGTVEFSDINLTCIMREVPDSVDAAIAKTSQGGSFSMHSKDYSNYTNVIPADSGSASVLIPCRVSSLSTILHCIRPTANWGNNNRRSITGRCTGGLTKFSYQINGVNIPQIAVPVETQTEGMDHKPNISQSLPHLLQALGLYEGVQPLGCGLERLLYFQKGDTAEDVFDADQENGGDFYTQSLGTFVFAVDLGSFPAEYDNVINAGLSTLTSVIMLNLEFSDEATTQSYRLSSFACYDSLYFIDDNGIMNVRR